MSTDRRPEVISTTLCAVSSILGLWRTKAIALHCFRVQHAHWGAAGPEALEEHLSSVLDATMPFPLWLWFIEPLLIAASATLRRQGRLETATLIALFLAPLFPMALLWLNTNKLLLAFTHDVG